MNLKHLSNSNKLCNNPSNSKIFFLFTNIIFAVSCYKHNIQMMTKNKWFVNKKDQNESGYIEILTIFHFYNIIFTLKVKIQMI